MVSPRDAHPLLAAKLEDDARECLRRFESDARTIATAMDDLQSVEALVTAYGYALAAGAHVAAQATWVRYYVRLERFVVAARKALGPGYDPATGRALIGFETILGDDLGIELFGYASRTGIGP